ncbi:TrkH family potassium uptake protein [Halomarina oriensis]|uniref:TrkH family potassium uptake protein n=1 Tax=Halomarina oriensis TaxID=671145 RepID=A0A6B0GKL7_9EURY|nr:TrkH family potassium uptake protein [Halomarina oriensis]MWG35160.1 TrkH family potassium uptake protein [Halomarina oriensis]
MRIRVDWRTSVSVLGTILKILALPLASMAALALFYSEPLVPFLVPFAGSLLAGVGLERIERDEPGPREAFLLVASAWLAVALVGAIPFVLAGQGTLADPVNALFESMSGITTTGATVVGRFEIHGRAILMWRQVLQWLGGLGILVLAVGLLSELSVSGAQLMETETRTQDVTKLTPRMAGTARLLGGLYLGLTALLAALLYGLHLLGPRIGVPDLAPEMTLYDAVAHALTTIATAGFSPHAKSVGAFSPAVQWVVVVGMFVGATNFVLLYHLSRGDTTRIRDSEEFRVYLGVVVGGALVVGAMLVLDGEYPLGEELVRATLFQVTSIVTTTGYATVDFDLWSAGPRHVLFLGMFVGGMAGSTTCSIKTLRWLVVGKTFRRDLFTAVHPRAIKPVRLSGAAIDEDTIRDIYAYTLVSVVIFGLLTVFVVVDASRAGVEVTEFGAMGAAASTFLNIGPAFGFAGPYGSYEPFPDSTKLVMVVMMWVGRIEIFPVLALLTRSFWES